MPEMGVLAYPEFECTIEQLGHRVGGARRRRLLRATSAAYGGERSRLITRCRRVRARTAHALAGRPDPRSDQDCDRCPMDITVILDILVVLVAAKVAAEIAERIGIPAVVGEIVAGILVGPSVLGWSATATRSSARSASSG